MYINPPHQAHEKEKLQSMIATLESGGKLPAVLVHQNQAYSGSHRLEAWATCEIEPEYVEITDEDYVKIMESMNLDPERDEVYDFEPFLEEAIWLGIVSSDIVS